MMKLLTLPKIITALFILLLSVGVYIYLVPASNTPDFHRDNASLDTATFSKYTYVEVEEIIESRIDELPNNKYLNQRLRVKLNSGAQKDQSVEIEYSDVLDPAETKRLKVGDKLVLGKLPEDVVTSSIFNNDENLSNYVIVDRYRINGLVLVVVVFLLLAIYFGRKKGIMSIAGLVSTILVLMLFTAPQLTAGKNPVLICTISAGVIAIATMLISHGFNKRTQLSVVSTLIALALATGISYVFVYLASLFGFGQADAFVLQTGFLGVINLKGLLLGGMIISLLGILDDVTTTQTATVEELYISNKERTFGELYGSAMSVGREHIASLINTLLLVYVGASLPLFLLLFAASNQPLWVLLNSEAMAEELVRALSGSIALILAVPISTLIASLYFKKINNQKNQ